MVAEAAKLFQQAHFERRRARYPGRISPTSAWGAVSYTVASGRPPDSCGDAQNVINERPKRTQKKSAGEVRGAASVGEVSRPSTDRRMCRSFDLMSVTIFLKRV